MEEGGGVLLTFCVFCISHYSSLRPLYTESNKLVLTVYFSEDPNTERFKWTLAVILFQTSVYLYRSRLTKPESI